MNREFIGKIYEKLYEDPEREFGKDDNEYKDAANETHQALEKLYCLSGEGAPELRAAIDEALKALDWQHSLSIKLAYLQGAEDRGKMVE